MVKGISRQVIVVQDPDKQLFEQAIFILKDEAVAAGVTDEQLLAAAKQAVRTPRSAANPLSGALWAAGGAVVTGIVWILTLLL